MNIKQAKKISKKLYYLTYMLEQFTAYTNQNAGTEESEALEIFASYLAKLADELYYMFNISELNI